MLGMSNTNYSLFGNVLIVTSLIKSILVDLFSLIIFVALKILTIVQLKNQFIKFKQFLER